MNFLCLGGIYIPFAPQFCLFEPYILSMSRLRALEHNKVIGGAALQETSLAGGFWAETFHKWLDKVASSYERFLTKTFSNEGLGEGF